MESEQGIEIDIRLVHHVEGIRLRFNDIQLIAVVPSAMRNVDVSWNASAKVKQCMHLHASLAVFPQSPCGQFDAGGYGGGVQSIQDVIHRYLRYGSLRVQRSDDTDEIRAKSLVDTIVSVLVGTGERRLGDSVPKAEMIENGLVRFKTQTYITQGVAACNLAEQQMQQLVIAGQVLRMPVPMKLGNKFVELITRYIIHDLGEDIATDIHNYAVLGLQNYSAIFKSKNQRPL